MMTNDRSEVMNYKLYPSSSRANPLPDFSDNSGYDDLIDGGSK